MCPPLIATPTRANRAQPFQVRPCFSRARSAGLPVNRGAAVSAARAANRELDRAAGGAATALATFERIMGVLDVLPTPRALTPEFRRWIEEQLAARERARKTKDFEEADRIRVELRARDVELEDTPSGTKWRVL